MPGPGPRRIIVRGTVVFRQTGCTARLQKLEFGINPQILRLALETECSDVGGDALDPQPVRYEEEADEEYVEVAIEHEHGAQVTVEHPERGS